MQEFCNSQQPDDWSLLPPTTQDFLNNLELPSIHPFCTSEDAFLYPNAPPMGPPDDPVSTNSLSALLTLWYFYVLPAWTLADMWVRLLSVYVSEIG